MFTSIYPIDNSSTQKGAKILSNPIWYHLEKGGEREGGREKRI